MTQSAGRAGSGARPYPATRQPRWQPTVYPSRRTAPDDGGRRRYQLGQQAAWTDVDIGGQVAFFS
jgi:hypothetical protein